MFANNGYPSVADIAAAFPNRGEGNGNGNGWGDGGWWVLIILLAMWGGFGGNGWGNGGGSNTRNSDFTDAAVQRGFDNQAVMNMLTGINSGLCSLGYDQLAQMNTLGNTVQQVGWGIQQSINADTIANMQNTNALSTQLASCCCDNRAAIKDLQYAISQNDCAIKSQIHETGDAIIQNSNWQLRNLQDTVTAGFAAAQAREDARYIRELETKVNTAERKSELGNLYNDLIAYLAPQARPSFLACNPCSGQVIPESAIQQIAWTVANMLNSNNCGCDCNPCGRC